MATIVSHFMPSLFTEKTPTFWKRIACNNLALVCLLIVLPLSEKYFLIMSSILTISLADSWISGLIISTVFFVSLLTSTKVFFPVHASPPNNKWVIFVRFISFCNDLICFSTSTVVTIGGLLSVKNKSGVIISSFAQKASVETGTESKL